MRKIIVLALAMSLAFNNTALANGYTSASEVSGVKSNEEYIGGTADYILGAHWKNAPGGWQYLDENGNPILGYFNDITGEFYYSGDNGYIITNEYDIYGQYHDSKGKVDNSGYNYDRARFEALSAELETGNNIYFDTIAELDDFIEYYGKSYNLGKQLLSFKTFVKKKYNSKYEVVSTKYFINNSLNTIYNRDQVILKMDALFPEGLVGNTVEEKVNFACELIKSRFKLDESDLNRSMKDALDMKSGCCWHVVKIMQRLLDRSGIEYEIISGKAYGNNHIWFRVKDENGNWIYSDPTFHVNGLNGYSVIDYRIYKDNYKNYTFF